MGKTKGMRQGAFWRVGTCLRKASKSVSKYNGIISLFTLVATVAIACVSCSVQAQMHEEDTRKSLVGDVLGFNMFETEEGEPVDGGDWVDLRVTIANDGAVTLFISDVYAEYENGRVVHLVDTPHEDYERDRGIDSYYVGHKIDPGQGVVFDMRLFDEEKHELLDGEGLNFYVQTVDGGKYVLTKRFVSAGSDTHTTTLTIAENWHRDEDGNVVQD